MTLAQTYFDKAKTARLVECLKRYKRAIHATTNEPGAPIHDEFSHGADDYRYLAIVADQLSNEEQARRGHIPVFAPLDSTMGY